MSRLNPWGHLGQLGHLGHLHNIDGLESFAWLYLLHGLFVVFFVPKRDAG